MSDNTAGMIARRTDLLNEISEQLRAAVDEEDRPYRWEDIPDVLAEVIGERDALGAAQSGLLDNDDADKIAGMEQQVRDAWAAIPDDMLRRGINATLDVMIRSLVQQRDEARADVERVMQSEAAIRDRIVEQRDQARVDAKAWETEAKARLAELNGTAGPDTNEGQTQMSAPLPTLDADDARRWGLLLYDIQQAIPEDIRPEWWEDLPAAIARLATERDAARANTERTMQAEAAIRDALLERLDVTEEKIGDAWDAVPDALRAPGSTLASVIAGLVAERDATDYATPYIVAHQWREARQLLNDAGMSKHTLPVAVALLLPTPKDEDDIYD